MPADHPVVLLSKVPLETKLLSSRNTVVAWCLSFTGLTDTLSNVTLHAPVLLTLNEVLSAVKYPVWVPTVLKLDIAVPEPISNLIAVPPAPSFEIISTEYL